MSKASDLLQRFNKMTEASPKGYTVSVALVDRKAIDSGKATIIAADITPAKFDALAQSKGFNIKRPDSTILGYYYFDGRGGSTLVTKPSFHKVGAKVSTRY